jgi:hypothetical protein
MGLDCGGWAAVRSLRSVSGAAHSEAPAFRSEHSKASELSCSRNRDLGSTCTETFESLWESNALKSLSFAC